MKLKLLALIASVAVIGSAIQPSFADNLSQIVTEPHAEFQKSSVIGKGMFAWGSGFSEVHGYGQITNSGVDAGWSAYLQPCSKSIIDYCIESVSSKEINKNEWTLGRVANWMPNSDDPELNNLNEGGLSTQDGSEATFTQIYKPFYIDSKDGLPKGGTPLLWSLKAKHQGGDTYLVSASISHYNYLNPISSQESFAINIVPVALTQNFQTNNANIWPLNYGERYQFPKEIDFQIKLRMGQYINNLHGWFKGKIQLPSVSVDKNVLTISGRPVDTLYGRSDPLPCQEWPQYKILEKSKAFCDSGGTKDGTAGTFFPDDFEAATSPNPIYPTGRFAYWENRMAKIDHITSWALIDTNVGQTGNCKMEKGNIGIVGSNAMIYTTTPPTWNQNDNSLNYNVGSFHTDLTGEIQKGTFDLAIPIKFASCLWGKDLAGAQANISFVYDGENPVISVSTLKFEKDIVYFNASGFTYSTPKIKIQLTYPSVTADKAAADKAAEQLQAAKLKPRIISCIKGKLIKKVVGSNPKCPSGYKQK